MATDDTRKAVRAAAETAARNAYGRLVAILTAQTCDIATAEDAVSAAFVSALNIWPDRGIPERPEAWLLTVARRNLIDSARRSAAARKAAPDMIRLIDEAAQQTAHVDDIPDERLKLMFICADPALNPGLHTPLMLQTVLGFDAARIAAVFLVSPSAMSQRLVRAKARLKTVQPGFAEPDRTDWPQRLDSVLQAIYAAYNTGWDSGFDETQAAGGFAREAAALARIVAGLLPGEPEALALLALILYCEARRPARRDGAGHYVPLAEQDAACWDPAMIAQAENLLHRALEGGPGARFSLEAAIQSVHCARAVTGRTDWTAVLALYERLLAIHPTVGAIIARAAALGESGNAPAGLKALDGLDRDAMTSHQPWWATRAHLLVQTGDRDGAADSYDRAAKLESDPAVHDFLISRREAL